MVFSIPRSLQNIKFGGWNSEENNDLFKSFRTDSKHWKIPAKTFKIGFTDLTIAGNRSISLDPAYPYMYLPTSDFAVVAERINTLSKAKVCNLSKGNCMIEESCDRVNKVNISMQISISAEPWSNVVIPNEHMYIPGDQLNDTPNRCYIPIFKQNLTDQTGNWIMGQIFFRNHYTVFDMTLYTAS
jgi:hypothetical protein